jgi:modulator of FtsH protease HflK
MENQEFQFRPPNPQAFSRYMLIGIVAVVVISAITSSYYTVNTDEKGVVLRFGKYNRITEPGLHFKIPFGIETVQTPKYTTVFQEEFGFRTVRSGIESRYDGKRYMEESLMLCGDLSVADVEWIVQYRVIDPRDFLFNVRNPQRVIRDVSEAVMRMIVGDSSVDEVLTDRRVEINMLSAEKMQETLNTYRSGLQIVAVRLQDVNPPESVKHAFNEVNAAQQEKERLINTARKQYNEIIPRTRGQAQQLVKQAEAYAIQRVNNAKGDASRFTQIYDEYKDSKDVTRRRMYLESMGAVLPTLKTKYIIDEDIKSLVPFMKMGEQEDGK